MTTPFLRLFLAVACLLPVVACSEADSPTQLPPPPAEPVATGLVLGSVDLSLTVFPVDSPTVTRTIGLAAAGTPVSMAVRGNLVAVPLGTAPALAVVDLATESVLRTIALPAGSGATGVDFINDSLVVVANPALNSVSQVNLRSGAVGPTVPVGIYPQGVLVVGTRVYVANSNLDNFVPAGPASLTVLDASTLSFLTEIGLTGTNAGGMAAGPDGQIYVMNSGSFGAADGSLSVVSPSTLTESEHFTGFGEFPSPVAFGADGTLYASSYSFGIVAWSTGTRTFLRGPANAITPAGKTSVAGVGVDAAGRIYALEPTCTGPSAALRLDPSFQTSETIGVGVCPTDIGFTRVTRE